MAEDKLKVGRLAMRQEGGMWNAYYALEETMDGAVFLGSIRMTAIIGYPERREKFLGMMRDIVADILEETIGERPSWGGEEVAPEHERSGSA